MRIVHIVPGLGMHWNGIAIACRMVADGQRQDGHQVEVVDATALDAGTMSDVDEVWVHSMWTPMVWRACWHVLKAGRSLVRMTHANLDPVRYCYHGWKKRLVTPIERYFFRRCARVVTTGAWETAWCRQWGVEGPFEELDMKRFFALPAKVQELTIAGRPLHLLYLGRQHPLKGIGYLKQAVAALEGIELRIESQVFGEEKERVWEWCDVLCLPTLSENFGLVVAEALERGKRVITTDGAPAWEGEPGVVYIKGFRDGNECERVRLLKEALGMICCEAAFRRGRS